MLNKNVSRALAFGAVAALSSLSELRSFEPGIRLGWEYRSAQPITSGVYARMISRATDDRWLLVYSDGPHVQVRESAPGGGPPFSAARRIATVAGYNCTNAELARLQNGWLVLGYNARPIVQGGTLPYQIRTIVSRDDGQTWSDERIAYTAGMTAEVGCWEPAFLQLPSGELLLLFANEDPYPTTAEQEIGLLRSFDNGLSWQDYGKAAFRPGSRDGMPVPLLLADGATAVFSIEDNGLNGRFKPAIVASPISDAWRSGPIGPASAQRWSALRSDSALPASIYAGAPYLARLSSGDLALSVQSTEGRAGTDHSYSAPRVYLGNAAARDFSRPSTPLPWLPATAAANWNSLVALSDDRVALLSSFHGVPSTQGAEAIWQVQARILRPIDIPYHTAVVDGAVDAAEWEGWGTPASPVYLGSCPQSDLTAHVQWDSERLYLLFRVQDAKIWHDSPNASTWEDDGVEVSLDPDNASAGLTPGLYRISVAPSGEAAFSQTGSGSTWGAWAPEGVAIRSAVDGTLNNSSDTDAGYIIEMSVPWSALGGRPATNVGWGIHFRLHHDNDGGVAEWHEDLGGNDPARPATWTGATLVDPVVAPLIVTQPVGQRVLPGDRVVFSVTASGSEPLEYQWMKNGVPISGATAATWVLPNAQVTDTGDYSVAVSNSRGRVVSDAVALAFEIVLAGSATQVGSDIAHPNGNIFDQVLLTGTTATVRADADQITRVSFIDLNDDIVQLEFAGAGQVRLTLESVTGPALPAKYDQQVAYIKGHAAIEVSGADRTSHLGITSVGKLTAFDPTGAYDVGKSASSTNDPLRNGNPIFRAGETYDGIADVALVTIRSSSGAFGGFYGGGAGFYRAEGKTGIDATGVEFTGPVVLHDITASGSASPVLLTGPVGTGLDEASGLRGVARIAGGDLMQPNTAPIQIDGVQRLRPVPNVTSHYAALPACKLLARVVRQQADVTDAVIEFP